MGTGLAVDELEQARNLAAMVVSECPMVIAYVRETLPKEYQVEITSLPYTKKEASTWLHGKADINNWIFSPLRLYINVKYGDEIYKCEICGTNGKGVPHTVDGITFFSICDCLKSHER